MPKKRVSKISSLLFKVAFLFLRAINTPLSLFFPKSQKYRGEGKEILFLYKYDKILKDLY